MTSAYLQLMHEGERSNEEVQAVTTTTCEVVITTTAINHTPSNSGKPRQSPTTTNINIVQDIITCNFSNGRKTKEEQQMYSYISVTQFPHLFIPLCVCGELHHENCKSISLKNCRTYCSWSHLEEDRNPTLLLCVMLVGLSFLSLLLGGCIQWNFHLWLAEACVTTSLGLEGVHLNWWC